MFKRQYALALASFLLISVVTVLGGTLFSAINPEIAAGHPNYERNYRLLALAKDLSVLAALMLNMGLWILTCFFLVKSRSRSYRWWALAALGPFGFIALTMLADNAPAPGDMYQRFIRRLKIHLRMALELCVFVVVWVLAYEAMVLKRDLMIIYEAATTSTSATEIISRQNASSGMWAFSEGLEVLYLVVLLYFLWPIVFNVLARLPMLRVSSRQS